MSGKTLDHDVSKPTHTRRGRDATLPSAVEVLPVKEGEDVDTNRIGEIEEDSAAKNPAERSSGKGENNNVRIRIGCRKTKEDKELIRLALHRNPFFTCMDEEQIQRFVEVAECRSFRPGEAVILEGCRDERMMYDYQADADESLGPADVDEFLLDEENKSNVNIETDSSAMHAESDAFNLALHTLDHVPPPFSASKPLLYIIKEGNADVLYHANFNPASLGPGTLFGEGRFLFGRQHSASIVAAGPLKCWVVGLDTFLKDVLNSENLKKIFAQHAHRNDSQGKLYMTMDDFIHSCLHDEQRESQNMENVTDDSTIENAYNSILSSSVMQLFNNNQIFLSDFCLFYLLISRPDPEIDIAFLLMDRHKTGSITKADFQEYVSRLPYYFDPESEFVERHFGYGQTVRNYQFSQFLVDLQKEMGRQAYIHEARQFQAEFEGEGLFLPAEQFVELLKSTCSWRLPPGVVDRLESLYSKGPVESAESTAIASVRAGKIKGDSVHQVKEYSKKSILCDFEQKRLKLGTRYFTYLDYTAFQEVLGVLPGIYNLIDRACKIKNGPISPDDFKVANRVLGLGGRLSRRQVDIIFQLFDLDRDGYVSAEDVFGVCGIEYAYRLEAGVGRGGKSTFAPPPKYNSTAEVLRGGSESEEFDREPQPGTKAEQPEHIVESILNHVTHFLLSSVAGGIGIATVYPLDLVKTRMMNQRISADSKRIYLSSFDCLMKVLRFEGIGGLYRGLLPPFMAVGPEKFIKFTVNDLLKGLSNSREKAHWSMEMVSGACAGACQLLVTNPSEITKIRLQMQGESMRLFRENGFRAPRALSFSEVAADLGFSGLYKGAQACLLRDIPFGAIYFPAYAVCKDYLADLEGTQGSVSASQILLAGTLAGIPASFLTTPADVVKTRLQVTPRPGDSVYTGIGDCVRKMYATEGPTAFFKGSLFRCARISPQFGISLLCYEHLSKFFGKHQAHLKPPTNAPIDPRDYRRAFNLQNLGEKSGDIDNLVKTLNMGFRSPKKPEG
ncbi:unnamed protein product [Cylindrotheca closterium]|uniref:Calmodulin n=1 Tax=Cylindrotheca closterium TaxID=2856 RepID=A0AAD2FE74_9STRA|nr:unnamed protein product [Cylindrotheca closterium]